MELNKYSMTSQTLEDLKFYLWKGKEFRDINPDLLIRFWKANRPTNEITMITYRVHGVRIMHLFIPQKGEVKLVHHPLFTLRYNEETEQVCQTKPQTESEQSTISSPLGKITCLILKRLNSILPG
jgi:hypothetical protein